MIPSYLSLMWEDLGPAVTNHLWQSTVVLAVVALLTLGLRKNQARTRYWLWLAASIKFLVPFSLLVSVGRLLPGPRSSIASRPVLYEVIEKAGQPFIHRATPATSVGTTSLTMSPVLSVWLPAVWFTGLVIVLVLWMVSWRRVSAAMREGVTLHDGREWEALRRLERRRGGSSGIRLLLSRRSLEPGIFGIVRPVLIWPAGISQRLDDAQMEAILAHEMCHVRRRDNLAAAMHMVVEAIFWFHPLVWWLGARLVEERERACDEEVLLLCSQPEVYAESILKVCEFCVESPVACVSGVTGSDLRKRIGNILAPGDVFKLNFGRKLLVAAVGLMVVAIPIVSGQMSAPQTEGAAFKPAIAFDVVSVKRDKTGAGPNIYSPLDGDSMTITNMPIERLIKIAYDFPLDELVSGLPDWTRSEGYDVTAKVADSDVAVFHTYGPEQRGPMLRSLMEDRLKLKVHTEMKELPVYRLVLAKGGSKMKEIQPVVLPSGLKDPGDIFSGRDEMRAEGIPMVLVLRVLTRQLGRKVVDGTGLTGYYNFTLKWTPEEGPGAPSGAAETDPSRPSIFTALQEQLGLKLESAKAPVQTLVIDHIERPSEN